MKPAFNVNTMSININLLQKREISRDLLLLPILLILLAAACSIALGWTWYDAQNKLADAKVQLSEVTTAAAALEAKLKLNNFTGRLTDVLSQPDLIRASKPVTTQLLNQLNKLIPQYANVTELVLTDQDKLTLTVYFATSEDLISFTQTVKASEHFKFIIMGAITNVPNEVGSTNGTAGTTGADLAATAVPASTNVIELPVYQATFELKYVNDGKRG